MKKICSKCKIEKEFNCFSADNSRKASKDGLRVRCKTCRAEDNRIWHEKNKLRSLQNSRDWKKRNPEKVTEQSRKWIANNGNRHKLNNKNWKEKNKSANCAISSRYRANKIKATPLWLSAIHKAQIQEFYDIAAARTVQTGVKYHVDHIHPLCGRTVSGLHVPWNMQIITAKENFSKKNKMIEVEQ